MPSRKKDQSYYHHRRTRKRRRRDEILDVLPEKVLETTKAELEEEDDEDEDDEDESEDDDDEDEEEEEEDDDDEEEDEEEDDDDELLGTLITIKRQRKDMNELFHEVGPAVFRKMYRMTMANFYNLCGLLEPQLVPKNAPYSGILPSEPISNTARLSMALRFFAGGSKFDIAETHEVHPNEVYKSVWRVVDAIHLCPALDITYPTKHDDQYAVAQGFAKQSGCGMDNCAGCIDGMLVWTNKEIPKEDLKDLGHGGSDQLYCERKKKFGLNMQAICDDKKRFLHVICAHPGSASDYTVWLDCRFRRTVEKPGFLKPGLALYGDNAYINTPYMITPFKEVSKGSMDAFNFYHSQVRSTIEGALGSLVHRWGCLRKPFPLFSLKKATRLVLALCKLHNYCIDCKEGEADDGYKYDNLNIRMEGGMTLKKEERVDQLLDGGEFVEEQHKEERQKRRLKNLSIQDLPIWKMLEHIESKGYEKPPC